MTGSGDAAGQQATQALADRHREMLERGSGISPEVIAERGYCSIDVARDLEPFGFGRTQLQTPGLLIPIWPTDGTTNGLYAFRPDLPRVRKDRGPIKYEWPSGMGMRLDVPPRCRPSLADPSIPLWITEGVKKVDALASHGLCAVALQGVWAFLGANPFGATTFLADWDHIALKQRLVRLAFDSDVTTKPSVRKALERLSEHLRRKGAHVDVVYLPNRSDGSKVGVDDYLLEHRVAELQALVSAPRPKPQPEASRVRLLEHAPVRLERPLGLIGDHAYVATWLYTEVTTSEVLDKKSGEVLRLDQPQQVVQSRLAIVRDDGQVFGVDDQAPLSALPFEVRLREQLRDHHTWSVQGVRGYRAGQRVVAANVFDRLVVSYDGFIDFARSLAPQAVMCRFMATFSLATWFTDQFDNVAYFHPNGEPGSGKTKLVEIWVQTAYLGQMVNSSSSFATLRDLADYGGSLGIDEAEALVDPKKADPHLRELILGGYRKTGSEIGLKEPAADGTWTTRWVKTFSPRAFAAIKLPDRVLGSRTIVIPLVKSTDKTKANRLPDHAASWPTERDALQSDLWSIGLQLQSRARSAWDRAPALQNTLLGRDFEPWRPLLAVALLFEEEGVTDLVADIRTLMLAYQHDRADLTYGRDLNRLIVLAISELAEVAVWQPPTSGDSRGWSDSTDSGWGGKKSVMRVVAADVARHIREHLKDDTDDDPDAAEDGAAAGSGWPSAEQVGRALSQLRIGERRRSGRTRWRELDRQELDSLIRAHVPNDTDFDPPTPVSTVTADPTVTTHSEVEL